MAVLCPLFVCRGERGALEPVWKPCTPVLGPSVCVPTHSEGDPQAGGTGAGSQAPRRACWGLLVLLGLLSHVPGYLTWQRPRKIPSVSLGCCFPIMEMGVGGLRLVCGVSVCVSSGTLRKEQACLRTSPRSKVPSHLSGQAHSPLCVSLGVPVTCCGDPTLIGVASTQL